MNLLSFISTIKAVLFIKIVELSKNEVRNEKNSNYTSF